MYEEPRFSMKQVPFEKPVISQPDKSSPAFCGSRMFIIVPTEFTIFPILSDEFSPALPHPFI
jgi:hypothetical protein